MRVQLSRNAWRFSGVGASEDRQIADDTCEHYPGMSIPSGF